MRKPTLVDHRTTVEGTRIDPEFHAELKELCLKYLFPNDVVPDDVYLRSVSVSLDRYYGDVSMDWQEARR